MPEVNVFLFDSFLMLDNDVSLKKTTTNLSLSCCFVRPLKIFLAGKRCYTEGKKGTQSFTF